ncbi:MAG: hypothetical protein RJA16_1137, partial [Planctomycetota bacterium]
MEIGFWQLGSIGGDGGRRDVRIAALQVTQGAIQKTADPCSPSELVKTAAIIETSENGAAIESGTFARRFGIRALNQDRVRRFAGSPQEIETMNRVPFSCVRHAGVALGLAVATASSASASLTFTNYTGNGLGSNNVLGV